MAGLGFSLRSLFSFFLWLRNMCGIQDSREQLVGLYLIEHEAVFSAKI